MSHLKYYLLTFLLFFWQLPLYAQEATDAVEEVGENVGENVGETLETAKDLISPTRILAILIILLAVLFIVRINNTFFDYLAERLNRYRLRILRLKPIINILIWIVAIYSIVVTLFNVKAEALYALGASSALALGFASQDILKNIFGGFMIILDRPFQIGDRIQIGSHYGEVVSIGLRTTEINTLDDSIVTIPNSLIISDTVSNANTGALDCMVVVDIWLPINIPVELVRKVTYEAAVTSRYLNIDKKVIVLFFDHFDKEPATNVKVKAYVLDARYEKAFAGDVTEAAKAALREAKIYNT